MLRERTMGGIVRSILGMRPALLRRIAGPPRRNDQGALLDLQVQAMLRMSDLFRIPRTADLDTYAAREQTEKNALMVDAERPAMARVEAHRVEAAGGPIPLRVYVPRRVPEPLPVFLFFHGGGWVIGSLDSHDGPCRRLARDADCIVVAVDYRLAPEHPFPAAVEDAIEAYRWLRSHAERLGGDPTRIAVGGDSAGGNLATELCIEARDAGEPLPAFQALIYPGTDLTRSLPSHRLFAEGYFIEEATIVWFLDRYLRTEDDARDPRASPLFVEDLRGLPPALVVTAGFDPLRDEGKAYADRLKEAGVPTIYRDESELIHGFLNMQILATAQRANDDLARTVRQALTSA